MIRDNDLKPYEKIKDSDVIADFCPLVEVEDG